MMAGRCGLKTAFFHVVILSCPGYEFRPLCSKRNYCELIPTKVVICLNPFNPKSDQYLFSPNNVTTFSREKAIRICKIITKQEIISLLTQMLVKLALQIYKNGRHELLNEVEETASVVYKDILDWIQQKVP